ncbi:uncharacterized protein RJT20DRAFT_95907 [Scheffersomyces xylosifermentans]|uniref:uncharacterized protein n=1 Tax=Scheffersomyces xylosifermentans TaxID=1304137 RepID=UPI00315D594A
MLNFNIWYYFIYSIIEVHSAYLAEEQPSFQLMNTPVNERITSLRFKDCRVPGYSFIEKGTDNTDNFKCSNVRFFDDHTIKTTKPHVINQARDLKMIRDMAKKLYKSGEYPILEKCFLDKEDEKEKDILRDKWFKFCGSSTWMDQYKVHFLVNRIVYSHKAHRNMPTISFVNAQVFDENWTEILDYKFPHSNLTFPSILPLQIDPNPSGKDEIMGTEDPRVILRKYIDPYTNEAHQEPVIIFNSRRTEINWKRAMHFHRPLTTPEKTVRMTIEGMKPRSREKNWAPFFDEDSSSINFVYSFNPLRVLKCDLATGVCRKISGPDFQKQDVGALRGGTNIIRVPSSFLPRGVAKLREYWFGIARSHDDDCGCLHIVYRPHIFLISRDIGSSNYTLDYVSSLVDFNINAETWNPALKNAKCKDGKNVLIPNSIAYWDTAPAGDNSDEPSDIMGITISEADRTNKIIHVKGILKHIRTVLGGDLERIIEHYQETEHNGRENELLGGCATSLANDYCKKAQKDLKWT